MAGARQPTISARIAAIDAVTGPARRIGRAFNTHIGKPLRKIDKLATNATRRIAGMTAKAAAGITAAAGAGAAALTKYIDKGDELAKLGRQLGISVEGLQELRFAADRMGVTSEIFERSFGAFTKRLGDAKAGGGALLGFLNKVSPALRDQVLGAENTEQAFLLMVEAMRKVQDPAKKGALASAAFSRAGMRMTRFADVAAEEISNLRREKRKLGVITTEEATRTEDAADKMANFSAAVGGIGVALAADVLPPLIDGLKRITEWIAASRGFLRSKLGETFSKLGEAIAAIDFQPFIDGIMFVVDTVRPILEELVGAFGDNWRAIFDAVKTVLGVLAAFMVAKWTIILSAVKGFVNNFGEIWGGIKTFLKGFLEFLEGVFTLDTKKILGGLTKMWDGLKGFFSGLWKAIKETFSTAATALGKLFDKFAPEPLKTAWEGFKTAMVAVWDGIKQAVQSAWDFIKPILDKIDSGITAAVEALDAINPFSDDEELGNLTGGVNAALAEAQAVANRASSQAYADQFYPLPAAPVAAGGLPAGAGDSETTVKVQFDNAPAGLKVATVTRGPAKVEANVGRRQVGTGGP